MLQSGHFVTPLSVRIFALFYTQAYVPNMVKWRKCEIIINNIYWFPRCCTQQSDVNSALSYLHSYLIYFLTDVKHNHK